MSSATHITGAIVLTLLGMASMARPAVAQTPLEAAVGLYASAAYEDALAALDKLAMEGASPADRVSADHAHSGHEPLGWTRRGNDPNRGIRCLILREIFERGPPWTGSH